MSTCSACRQLSGTEPWFRRYPTVGLSAALFGPLALGLLIACLIPRRH